MTSLTSSHYCAQTRAVIAVDIVGSSQASDDLLDPMKTEMETLLEQSLATVGLSWAQAEHVRETGDGAMLAFPDHRAGQVAEVVFYLDHLLRARNRDRRVPMRARVAVHLGPMTDHHRYHRTYITLTRLLSSAVFGDVVRHWCRADPSGERFGAGLVMSEAVWQSVVEPFSVALVPPARCSPIDVVTADFTGNAWIHLPGLDSDDTLERIRYPVPAMPQFSGPFIPGQSRPAASPGVPDLDGDGLGVGA
ncbi:adenylate/guanylate cyclase domain-containing protein [Amycolatopsis jejuensis]|uniref:adenylate/guanylate cyclase domain-containing protein n=1 Tax=Amycolatopsis jejuensis TaxID=330084 RepID=UPI000B12A42B|nr:adenylate/guanylate cyclase domain-containing protein [Amycolatopsis jejuensis]